MSDFSRRNVLKLPVAVVPFLASQPINANTFADPAGMNKWMSEWMRESKRPEGSLHLSRFADPIYFTTRPISWIPEPEHAGRYPTVTVPPGFVTDFASIPRIFWSALRPDGNYTYAAIVHDFLYWDRPYARGFCDEIFELAMRDFAIGKITRGAIFLAVSEMGGEAWNENGRLKDAGEKRLLVQYPSDPRTTWAQWKQTPDNFK